jgi:uncharacterized protein (DUF1778 family)
MAQAAKIPRPSRKEERLEARIAPEQKRLIERAAELRGTTVTEFVILSAQQEAARTIKDFEVLSLSQEAREVFVAAMLNPPPPSEALRAAARRYRKRMRP